MSVDFDEATEQWRVDDEHQTVVLSSRCRMLPEIIYWGAPLPRTTKLDDVAYAAVSDLNGGMLDVLPPLSLCPEVSRSFQGQPGLVITSTDGIPIEPGFTLESVMEDPDVPGTLVFVAWDRSFALRYTARIGTTPSGLIALSSQLDTDQPIRLQWLAAPVFPAPQLADELIDYSGRWLNELQPNRVPWSAGVRMCEARSGRSGHEHYPAVILPLRGASNTQGEAMIAHYGWSGGHRMIAEELSDGRRQLQFGHTVGAERAASTHFETAVLHVAWTDQGLNDIGIRFQRYVRDHLVPWPDAERPRPVQYNCWEAVFFDHSLKDLSEIATQAALLGAERFVLDDGWFGRRDDDTSSLGDWTVHLEKWPGGLEPLIQHVQNLGMTFGLWFEPEMINVNSDLYRAHADWVLGKPDQVTGRDQLVLDLSKSEVRTYLFNQLDVLLTEYPIEYIKWDHNRVLPFPDAAQTRGVYALLDQLLLAHPTVEIESCASGGGRMDCGILSRTHRLWLSDSNDPFERFRIQHEAALFFPAVVSGAHVGGLHSHSSGRLLPIAFRAWTAAQRHLGFEMDLRELSEQESDVLTRVTSWWKSNRHWMMNADILRLDSADPNVLGELHRSADRNRFVVFAGQLAPSQSSLPRPLRLCGLDNAASYRIKLANPEDAANQSRGVTGIKHQALLVSGAVLMGEGVRLPVTWPGTCWVLEGELAEAHS